MSIAMDRIARPSRVRRAPTRANVVIVGAGQAGLGMARVPRDLVIRDVRIVERDRVVTRLFAGRLGVGTGPLEAYCANNMFLDDLSCCEAETCLC